MPIDFLRTVRPILALLLLFVAADQLAAQGPISPTVLYPGENRITVTAPAGIRSVGVEFPDSATFKLIAASNQGVLSGCPTSHTIGLDVGTATRSVRVTIVVTGCDGSTQRYPVGLNMTWSLDEVVFPDVNAGETACRPFQIRLGGISGITTATGRTLDSVSSPDPRISFEYTFPPPIEIANGTTYRYTVCFTADKPGIYKFPIITWLRRDNPTPGLTNYPVADTGVIRVLPRGEDARLVYVPFDSDTLGADNPQPIVDPTTFRSVAVPNAVRPKRGKLFLGSYDVIGLTAGYGVADELLLFAGGTPPTPDDWGGVQGDLFGAFGVGAKVGVTLFDKLDIAAGYVYGQSILDKEFTEGEVDSRIIAHVPWGAISYGTDDSRISITGGYALKNHRTWFEDHPAFGPWREIYDTNAVFGAVGGDYRFARHWKVAAEVPVMETVDVIPVIATVRYFTNTFAIDFGVAYAGFTINDAEAPPIPVVPMLSGILVL